jgi:hypothetical protein
MTAAMKCTLLTFVFIGQFKTKWGMVKYSAHINPLNAKLNPNFHLLALLGAHHILHFSRVRVKIRWQNILTITWGYLSNTESHYALRNMELPITNEILDKIFQHTNWYILISQPNFSPKGMPNSQTKLS